MPSSSWEMSTSSVRKSPTVRRGCRRVHRRRSYPRIELRGNRVVSDGGVHLELVVEFVLRVGVKINRIISLEPSTAQRLPRPDIRFLEATIAAYRTKFAARQCSSRMYSLVSSTSPTRVLLPVRTLSPFCDVNCDKFVGFTGDLDGTVSGPRHRSEDESASLQRVQSVDKGRQRCRVHLSGELHR